MYSSLYNNEYSNFKTELFNATLLIGVYFSVKNKSASIEDISVNSAERQTKIRERLKKFFHRRPTVESLVKKGIWKGL